MEGVGGAKDGLKRGVGGGDGSPIVSRLPPMRMPDAITVGRFVRATSAAGVPPRRCGELMVARGPPRLDHPPSPPRQDRRRRGRESSWRALEKLSVAARELASAASAASAAAAYETGYETDDEADERGLGGSPDAAPTQRGEEAGPH